MHKNREIVPYTLLFLLIIGLIFLAGVRYGGSVERANTTLTQALSEKPSPTKAPEKDIPENISYNAYENTACGVSFLLPHVFEIVEPTVEQGGVIVFAGQNVSKNGEDHSEIPLRLACSMPEAQENTEVFRTAVLESESSSESADTVNKDITILTKRDGFYFIAISPDNNVHVRMAVADNLYPLIQSSLKRIPKEESTQSAVIIEK